MTEYQLLVIICLADVCTTILLFVEYFWGRPDVVLKHEEEQQKRMRRPKKQEPVVYEKEMD